MPKVLTNKEVAAFRLARHHLINPSSHHLATVCEDVCGIQAQVASAARLALWKRSVENDFAAIERALKEDRTLVKSYFMRGTLHLVSKHDFPIYITALRASRRAALNSSMSRFGIHRGEVTAMINAILEVLRERPLTKAGILANLSPTFSKQLKSWMEQVWSVFKPPIIEGLICYGAEQGQEVTFVRVDQWLPSLPTINEKEAQEILLCRFLKAYGPATVNDFAKWSGMTMKESREIWQASSHLMQAIEIDGQSSYLLTEDYPILSDSSLPGSHLCLLPSFDIYLLAHANKDHLVSKEHYKKVYRNQGWISAVILLEGAIIGVWSYQLTNENLIIRVDLFGKASRRIKEMIEQEATSYATLWQKALKLEFEP